MSLKRIILIVILAAGVLGAYLWFTGESRDYTNFPPAATGPWIAFGDSLTEGYGASTGHDYPTLLGQRLGIAIQNHGRSGETSSDALKRVDEIVALEPRVVLLCFGGNDSLQGEPASRTFGNLAQLIDRFHARGTFVVLIGIRTASLRDRNEKQFGKLAREKRVLYVPDMLKGLAFRPIYMSDAIHPNDAGYARIAERLEKALSPIAVKIQGN
jgi:acyl-CoA thioesterase I